jgi:hypothetical protein
MWIFKFGVPILALLGFGHAVYEVFTGKLDAEKMGLEKRTLDMFGVANLLMVLCWGLILAGLLAGAAWPKPLAFFITGMFFFDYLVSLPLYRNVGDDLFKFWAGAAVMLQVAYCIWL